MRNLSDHWTPAKLGMRTLNLKAVDNTAYDSVVLDLANYTAFLASLVVTETGSSAAGAAKLSVVLLADDDESNELAVIDILTAIDTTNSTKELIMFGRGLAAVKLGTGTIGAAMGILAAGVGKCKFRVTVTTQNDGTTCVADLRLRASI